MRRAERHRYAAALVAGATLLVAALTGCTTSGAPSAAACARYGAKPMQLFTLYFGRAVSGRADVSDAEWAGFVTDTVALHLPDGFTVFDARGGWLNPRTHRTVEEATKVLQVALPDSDARRSAIERVRAAYQARFHQQLVGMTVQPLCAVF